MTEGVGVAGTGSAFSPPDASAAFGLRNSLPRKVVFPSAAWLSATAPTGLKAGPTTAAGLGDAGMAAAAGGAERTGGTSKAGAKGGGTGFTAGIEGTAATGFGMAGISGIATGLGMAGTSGVLAVTTFGIAGIAGVAIAAGAGAPPAIAGA